MEFVALSDTVLQALALDDPQLRRVFQGVYPAHNLPRSPTKTVRVAHIVNTDPVGEPGKHWLGLWTEQTSARSLSVMGYPCTCIKTRIRTSGGVNGSTSPSLTSPYKPWIVRRVDIMRYFS